MSAVRGPERPPRLNVSPGLTMVPDTRSASVRLFVVAGPVSPAVVNSPMTSVMPSAPAASVVTLGFDAL